MLGEGLGQAGPRPQRAAVEGLPETRPQGLPETRPLSLTLFSLPPSSSSPSLSPSLSCSLSVLLALPFARRFCLYARTHPNRADGMRRGGDECADEDGQHSCACGACAEADQQRRLRRVCAPLHRAFCQTFHSRLRLVVLLRRMARRRGKEVVSKSEPNDQSQAQGHSATGSPTGPRLQGQRSDQAACART